MNQTLKYTLAGTAAFVFGVGLALIFTPKPAQAAPVTPTLKQGQPYQIQVADATGATDPAVIQASMTSQGWLSPQATGPSQVPTEAGTAGIWSVTATWGGANLAFDPMGAGFIPPSLALLTITGPGLS